VREPVCYRRRVRASNLSVTFLFLLGCTLLAAGCGGSSREDYQQDLAKAGTIVERALAKMPADEQTSVTPDQVHELADQLRDASGELDGLDAPDDAAAAQAKLERGLANVADAFDGLADDLAKAKDEDARAELFVAFAANAKIDDAFNDIAAAQTELAAKGYHVFRKGAAPAAPAGSPN
jgi:hypothetical protein